MCVYVVSRYSLCVLLPVCLCVSPAALAVAQRAAAGALARSARVGSSGRWRRVTDAASDSHTVTQEEFLRAPVTAAEYEAAAEAMERYDPHAKLLVVDRYAVPLSVPLLCLCV